MRRFSGALSVIAVFLLGIVVMQAQPVVVAQEATPFSHMEDPEGVTFEPLALASGVALPGE